MSLCVCVCVCVCVVLLRDGQCVARAYTDATGYRGSEGKCPAEAKAELTSPVTYPKRCR